MIIKKIVSVFALFSLTVFSIQLSAMTASEAVDNLAQGCYVIKSPTSNKYVKQYHSGGIENDGENFGFRTTNSNDADKFFFKPTRYKHFMLTNAKGRYLATRLPADPTAGTYPGKFAEWYIQAIAKANGKFQYRFKVIGLNRTLRHNYSTNNFYFIDLLNPSNRNSETDFILEPASDCKDYPEIEVNVVGDPGVLKGSIDQPIRGFIDPHTHITSYEFMGGKFMHGKPFHRFGVTEALDDSEKIHGTNGSLDLIGNIFAYDDINNRYDTRGWPDFPYWPSYKDVSHMGYYYKWIERAYLGGLRMMVTHLVENKVLCVAQSTINPAAWINANSCEAMDSIRLQASRLYQMQDYIDAQSGGPGKGFFRIVLSPQQARQVIADGKLAVLMGIEASEIFDCGVQGGCTRHTIERQLQEVYELGVRGFFPTHRFDNKIGGAKIEGGFLNVGQWLSAGYLFDTERCDDDTKGARMEPGFPLLNDVPILGDIANGISNAPAYDTTHGHCNQQGLSELGVYLINRMIDMKMLIELDHASEKTAENILDIVEARGYSGIISGHSHLSVKPDNGVHNHFKRLVKVGGFVTPYNQNAYVVANSIDKYLTEVEATPYLNGVSFATDMSGLGNQPGPRDDVHINPLQYPFESEFGLVFNKQKSGNRVLDYNQEGMAHFGMLADHLQDIRERASVRIYESIMNSTEAYLQMWERALAHSDNNYYNPLDLKVVMVNRHSQKCVDVPGNDDNLKVGVRVQQSNCDYKQADQRWIYDDNTGHITASLDKTLCLDSRQTQNHGQALLRKCQNEDWSKWNYDSYALRNKANSQYVLDGSKGDNRMWMYAFHGDWNQDWELRSEREVYVWTTFRTAMGNGCLDIHNGDTSNGNYFKLENCHNHPAQLFYYNPKDGTVRSALNANKCMDIPNGNLNNNTTIVIWDCNGGMNQQWDYDGGVFRSRMNHNKVIDVNGSSHGSEVSIWDYHGRSNQRWRAVLQ